MSSGQGYPCPNEGCPKSYLQPAGLEYHLQGGRCRFEKSVDIQGILPGDEIVDYPHLPTYRWPQGTPWGTWVIPLRYVSEVLGVKRLDLAYPSKEEGRGRSPPDCHHFSTLVVSHFTLQVLFLICIGPLLSVGP